jgi:predicted ArsR family transcriptional regulator
MIPAPSECRILTALLLEPMDGSKLARVLDLTQDHIQHRISYLMKCNEVHPKDHCTSLYGRPATRYALTPRGYSWAVELVS